MSRLSYMPPQLTVVTFRAERGYADSVGDPLAIDQLNLWMYEDGVVMQGRENHVEIYQVGNNWVDGDNHFWD